MPTLSRRPRLASSIASEDIYTFGYSPTAIQMLKGRTARSSASSSLYTPREVVWIGLWSWQHTVGWLSR